MPFNLKWEKKGSAIALVVYVSQDKLHFQVNLSFPKLLRLKPSNQMLQTFYRSPVKKLILILPVIS